MPGLRPYASAISVAHRFALVIDGNFESENAGYCDQGLVPGFADPTCIATYDPWRIMMPRARRATATGCSIVFCPLVLALVPISALITLTLDHFGAFSDEDMGCMGILPPRPAQPPPILRGMPSMNNRSTSMLPSSALAVLRTGGSARTSTSETEPGNSNVGDTHHFAKHKTEGFVGLNTFGLATSGYDPEDESSKSPAVRREEFFFGSIFCAHCLLFRSMLSCIVYGTRFAGRFGAEYERRAIRKVIETNNAAVLGEDGGEEEKAMASAAGRRRSTALHAPLPQASWGQRLWAGQLRIKGS